jgi:RNA polymerase sigma-70 factor (ECF subfamily)
VGPSNFEPRAEELLAHAVWIRKLALQLARDAAAAEDLVQETWLAALRARPDARWPLAPWLGRVLRTQAALARRRERARAARDMAAARGEALPSAEELALRAEAQRRVVQAVLGLEEPYRSLIVLCYYEGLSPTEIARRRGVSGATLRSQLHRGRERLREQLDADFGGSSRGWRAALAPLAGARDPGRAVPEGELVLTGAWRLALGALVACGATTWLALTVTSDAERAGEVIQPAREVARGDAVTIGALARASSLERSASALATSITVRVVDEDSGEPLPYYELDTRGAAGASVRRTTDAAGMFELPWTLQSSAGTIELIDHPRLLERVSLIDRDRVVRRPAQHTYSFEQGAGEAVLAVPAGPTYHLDLTPPPGVGLAELHAHLRSRQANFYTQRWQEHVAPVRAADTSGAAWVRFAPLEARFIGHDPPWILEVFSADGLWSGAAEVHGIRGVQAERVAVELRPGARVVGVVTDASGLVTEDVAVTFHAAEGGQIGLACDTDHEGRYASGRLAPGRYTVRAVTPRHAPLEIALELRGGEVHTQDLTLARAQAVGTVEGVLGSRTGTYEGPVLVLLESADGGGRRFFGRSVWEGRPGERCSPFHFADVPAGRYTLRLLAIEDQLPWEPSGLVVDAPATGLRLDCQDDQARCELVFHALDAETGALLPECTFVYELEGGPEVRLRRVRAAPVDGDTPHFQWEIFCAGLVWAHRSGAAQLGAFARDGRLRWGLFAPGRAPRFGDAGDFTPADGRLLARVPLQRGWGARLRLTDERSGAPLGGAELWADGRPIARSGSDGVVAASLSAPPVELDLRLPGWRPTLDLDPARLGAHVAVAVPLARR